MEFAFGLPDERWPAFQAISGSPGWFQRFQSTFIADCMCQNDESADRIIGVLSSAWAFAEEKVLQLMLEHWESHPHHNTRVWRVLQNAKRWTDPALKLACAIVRRTEIAPFEIDYIISSIGVDQPESALHLARACLDRQFATALKKAEKLERPATTKFENPEEHAVSLYTETPRYSLNNLLEHEQDWDALPTLAEQTPVEFLRILWPWFENYFETLKDYTDERQGRLGYALGFDGDFRFEQEPGMDLPAYPLLSSLQTAAEVLARDEPDTWLDWVAKLSFLDMAPAHRLIAHTFAMQPERFARPALRYLLNDPRRYILGSIHDMTGTSARLVREASHFWSSQDIACFESAVRSYRPAAPSDLTDPADRRDWNLSVREIELALLRALPEDRLSAEARRYVDEEKRALPDRTLGSRFVGPGFIGSIMDATQIADASNDDVLKAFRTVPDSSDWNHPQKFMLGGNIQLSREFATFAKDNLQRASLLLRSMEAEHGTRAAGYALEAMSESCDPAQVLQLLLDVVSRGFRRRGVSIICEPCRYETSGS